MTFLLSKLAWAVVSPGSLLSFLLALGVALGGCRRLRVRRAGRGIVSFCAACFLSIAVFPVGEWALLPLENRFYFDPPDQVDGVIVIGGDENARITEARGEPTALDSMRRYRMFSDLSRRYPDARLVFSGGPVFPRPNARLIDADVARDILADIGVPVDHVIFEKTSRNTWENAVFSADIVRPDPAQKWLLVTSAWHMPRAMGCFRRAGWNVYAAPTGYFTDGTAHEKPVFQFSDQMYLLTRAAHEYIGLAAYRLLGRTDALWPQP